MEKFTMDAIVSTLDQDMQIVIKNILQENIVVQ